MAYIFTNSNGSIAITNFFCSDRYDPKENKWSKVAPMNTRVSQFLIYLLPLQPANPRSDNVVFKYSLLSI